MRLLKRILQAVEGAAFTAELHAGPHERWAAGASEHALAPPNNREGPELAASIRGTADCLMRSAVDQLRSEDSTPEEHLLALLSGRSCLNLGCTCLEGATEASMKTNVRARAGAVLLLTMALGRQGASLGC